MFELLSANTAAYIAACEEQIALLIEELDGPYAQEAQERIQLLQKGIQRELNA